MNTKNPKKNRLKLFFLFLIFFLLLLPLVYLGIAFAGRISPDSVIPDSFTAYMYVPNPIRTADKMVEHKPFSDIVLTPRFSSYLPVVSQIKNSNILKKKLIRFAGNGALEGALFYDDKFLAAWDFGIASPLIRFFPNILEKLLIPNLYRGEKSIFEYRVSDDNVVFIQPYKNLLIISNNFELFESVLNGSSRDVDLKGSGKHTFLTHDSDAMFLVASESIVSWLSNSSQMAGAFLKQLNFADYAELGVSVFNDKIEVSITSHIASDNENINKLISRNSKTATLLRHLPAATQYSTVVSIGSAEELLKATLSVSQKKPVNLRQIDRAARFLMGVGLNDLLFSWTGTELAILGVEGVRQPLFVLQISDEQKRKEIFEKLGDVQVASGSAAVPQVNLPGIVSMILESLNIKISDPYYVVQNGYLFLSESSQPLVSAVDSIRKDDLLQKTELWESLAKPDPDESSLELFYSLDNVIPFFMNSNDSFEDALKLYKHGLVTVNITNGVLKVDLVAMDR